MILAEAPTVDVPAGEPYFAASLPAGRLLIVERGFVVLRTSAASTDRAVVTCEAGPGRVLLAPTNEEVLFALVDARLTVLTGDVLEALLEIPPAGQVLLDRVTHTLAQKQEAIGTFASTRHLDRVRRKLLQLARDHGRVARDGIRIDFPLSHALLGEMIGSSRETVTRALDQLQRDGFVARRGHGYRLLVTPEAVPG